MAYDFILFEIVDQTARANSIDWEAAKRLFPHLLKNLVQLA